MELADSILRFLKIKDNKNAASAPEGICPNCWGREEYGGHFYKRIQQENLDVNSSESNVGWVQAYANKHFKDIALQRTGNGEELVCEKCKVSFQHNDDHTS